MKAFAATSSTLRFCEGESVMSGERPKRLVANSHSEWSRLERTDCPGVAVLLSALCDLSRRRGGGGATGALFWVEVVCDGSARDNLLPRKARTMVEELSGERLAGPATEEPLEEDILVVVPCEAAPADSLREDLREELPASE